MTYYSKEEEKDLNKQLARWKKRQLNAVRGNNIDKAYEKMSEIESAVWEKIANAESYKDVNYPVWNLAERVIDKFCKLAR